MNNSITKRVKALLIPTLLVGISFSMSSCNNDEYIDAALKTMNLNLDLVSESLALRKHVEFSLYEKEYRFDINWQFDTPDYWVEVEEQSNEEIIVYQPVNLYKEFSFVLNISMFNANYSYSKDLSGRYKYQYNMLDSIADLDNYNQEEAVMIEGTAIIDNVQDSFLLYDGKDYVRVNGANTDGINNKYISLIANVEKITEGNFSFVSLNYLYHSSLYSKHFEYDVLENILISDLANLQADTSLIDNYQHRIVKVKGYLKEIKQNYYVFEDNIEVSLVIDDRFARIMLIDLINMYCEFDLFTDFTLVKGSIYCNLSILKITTL